MHLHADTFPDTYLKYSLIFPVENQIIKNSAVELFYYNIVTFNGEKQGPKHNLIVNTF